MEQNLREAIKRVVADLGMPEVDFSVEHPADSAHGDFATNVALVVAKQAGEQPRHCAERIVAALLTQSIPNVASIEIAGPGFINITLARTFFSEQIHAVCANHDTWGRNELNQGKKIIIEYTDPNPFKEFHIGHLFTNSVGETLSRLFAMSGADVKRANYQGDVGMHVAHAVWGMQQLGITADSECSARDLGKAYALGATAYKEDKEAQEAIRRINKAIYERSDDAINALYDKGRKISLAYFETIYEIIGTKFDFYFFESEAAPLGKQLVIEHPNVFEESDGAKVFKGEEYGLHTRVFLNSEGLPTYEAKELALAQMKFAVFPYDHSVVSTSNEINEYFKVLKQAMSLLYPDLAEKTEHIGHGTVRLTTGKMSSRTGDVIAALDFITEIQEAAVQKITSSQTDRAEVIDPLLAQHIALGAIKYATLRSEITKDSVFDKEKALSFEGDSGPYLQYTHARICSVLEKAEEVGVVASVDAAPASTYELERIVARFPEVVAAALGERAPHHLVRYLTDLAGAFNTFYAHEKIADLTDAHAPYKVLLADAVRQTLKNGLWCLGIQAPEKM